MPSEGEVRARDLLTWSRAELRVVLSKGCYQTLAEVPVARERKGLTAAKI